MKLKKILEPKLPATYQVATSQDFIDGEIYQACLLYTSDAADE